jgi:hypothetical protein
VEKGRIFIMLFFTYGTILRAFCILAYTDLVVSENSEAVQSVGKLRSSADVAFSKGEIDQALKLWDKVVLLYIWFPK